MQGAMLTSVDLARRTGAPMARKHKFLSAAKRQSMPRSEFALPGKGEGPKGAGAGSYPIPDEAHARNALARAAQHASPAERAEIKRKVHAKFPDIKIGGEGDKKKNRYQHPRSRAARGE